MKTEREMTIEKLDQLKERLDGIAAKQGPAIEELGHAEEEHLLAQKRRTEAGPIADGGPVDAQTARYLEAEGKAYDTAQARLTEASLAVRELDEASDEAYTDMWNATRAADPETLAEWTMKHPDELAETMAQIIKSETLPKAARERLSKLWNKFKDDPKTIEEAAEGIKFLLVARTKAQREKRI